MGVGVGVGAGIDGGDRRLNISTMIRDRGVIRTVRLEVRLPEPARKSRLVSGASLSAGVGRPVMLDRF